MSEATIRLSEIQKQLKAPKGQRNSFGNYNYRSLEDIMEAIKPLLKEDEFVGLSDEIVLVGDRYYVKATAQFSKGSQSIMATAYAREPFDKKGMDTAQITGATSSYARKYACNGLFAIDDTKDADTMDNHEKQEGRNTGVRIPAGYWKQRENDPQGAQELLGGEGYFPMKTDKGYFIGTSHPEKDDKAFVETLGPKKVLQGAPEPSKTAPESFISPDQQLEIVSIAKERGLTQAALKFLLKDQFGVDGWSKIPASRYLEVYGHIESLESAGVGK